METVTLEQPTSILLTQEDLETVVVERDSSITVQNNQIQTATVEQNGTIVAEEQVLNHVIQGGVQGPPGVPGASTQFEYHPAGATLGGNRAVTVNSNGQLVYPDTTQVNSWCLGVTKHSALTGELVQVQIFGSHTEPSWNWNPGEPVFLGTSGVLTQTQPTTGQLIVVGTSQTPTRIFIDINPPIYMG